VQQPERSLATLFFVLSIQRLPERMPLVVFILLLVLLVMLVGIACACATEHPMKAADRAVSAALPFAEPASGGAPYPCTNGDWTPTFRALGPSGEELLTAQITLASTPIGLSGGGCGWANGPHA
jgi:hypothetical protein